MAGRRNFIALLCFYVILHFVKCEENIDIEWTLYEPADFDKNELCATLTCSSEELCFYDQETARCGRRDEIPSLDGTIKFFVDEENSVNILDGESGIKEIKPNKEDYELKHENSKTHERHGPLKEKQNCSDLELRSVKERLFKWFSDLHGLQKNELFYKLPKHDISCNENVGFMFNMLNGDKNDQLTIDELYSLDYDPHEKCVKPLLDRCDIDSDDDLSLDEWCSCFQWSTDEFHEPACHAALRKHDPHDPNSYLPSCDLEGFYKLDQCHLGTCWCVDKWGRQYDRSRTTRGKANCQKYVL